MNRIGRRVSAAVNPLSTAATRWWCHSAVRHRLTGHGPAAGQRQLVRRGMRGGSFTPSAGQLTERAAATDELLSGHAPDDHHQR
jgi:hypothetical protein